MAILIIVSMILIFFNVKYHFLSKGVSDGISMSVSVCIWSLILLTITELLSLFSAISLRNLILCWGCINIILLYILMQKGHLTEYQRLCGKYIGQWRRLSFGKYIVPVFIVSVIVISIWMHPYNYDSMTYHLVRIVQWNQNGSISHFATNDIRQIACPPFSEIVNLHVYILSGQSDNYLNLVQSISYLLNALLVYLISKKLGCSPIWSGISCILFLGMPIAIAEAFTTQNDNFGALWLLIFIYILLDFIFADTISINKMNMIKSGVLGCCLSFGYLTKSTVLFAMIVLSLWFLINIIHNHGKIHYKEFICLLTIVFIFAIMPIIPESIRNLKTFHTITVNADYPRQIVETLDPRLLFLCFLKNLFFNTPNPYIDNWNDNVMYILQKISSLLHVELSDPKISFTAYQLMPYNTYQCDTAINYVIILLLILCVFTGLIFMIIYKRNVFSSYFFAVFISVATFFCLLKFTLYRTRYEIGYLALLCPAICQFVMRVAGKSEKKKYLFSGIICFMALITMSNAFMFQINRCLHQTTRFEDYFYSYNGLPYYTDIIACIREEGYKTIGLCLPASVYEYPLWQGLKNDVNEIQQINVENESCIYEDKNYQPDCIIWCGQILESDMVEYNGVIYDKIFDAGNANYVIGRSKQ